MQGKDNLSGWLLLSQEAKALIAHDWHIRQVGSVCRMPEVTYLDTEGVSWGGYKAPVKVLKALRAARRKILSACEAASHNEAPLSSSLV